MRRQRDALGPAGRIVDQDRAFAAAFGVIEDERRTELADRRGTQTMIARRLEHGRFPEAVAATMLVDFAQDRVKAKRRQHAAIGRGHRKARVDRIAIAAGIAKIVAGCECRRIGGGERRKQRMRILEVDPAAAKGGYRRRRFRRNRPRAEPVRHEQDHVVGASRFFGHRGTVLSAGRHPSGEPRTRAGNGRRATRSTRRWAPGTRYSLF